MRRARRRRSRCVQNTQRLQLKKQEPRQLTRRCRRSGDTRSPWELHSGRSSRWRATALGCGRSNNTAGSRRRQVRPHSRPANPRLALFTWTSHSCARRAGAGPRAALGLAPGCPPRLRRVREHARRHPSLAADAPAVGGTARRRAARWSARLRGSRGARLRRSGTRLRGGRWSARLRGSRGGEEGGSEGDSGECVTANPWGHTTHRAACDDGDQCLL